MSYRLKRKEKVAAGICRVARGQMNRARRGHTDRSLNGGDPVHQTRKSIKKLRALLRLIRSGVPSRFFKSEHASWRNMGRLLAPLRDAHVLVRTISHLQRAAGPKAATQFAAAKKWLRHDENRSRSAGNATLARVEILIEKSQDRVARWPLKNLAWRHAAAGLAGSYGAARHAFRKASRKNGDTGALHEWRKRTKEFHYHLRLLCNFRPSLMKKLARKAGRLAKLLGDDHDRGVLSTVLEMKTGLDSSGIRTLISRERRRLRKRAVLLGEKLFAEKPKHFEQRIRDYAKTPRRRRS